MKETLRQIARNLRSKILPYRPIRISIKDWEAQYSSRSWNYLSQIGELARYSVIVGYSYYFDEQIGSVLDIGCGEGILHEKLRPHKYSKYVGIDISSEAIRLASNNQDDRTFFLCADAMTYSPDEEFDIIIFNECLYYFKDPLKVVKMYEGFLKKDGLIIVSMHVTERTMKIWKILTPSDDSTLVTNRTGTSWIIACWKKDSGGARPVTAGQDLRLR